MALPRVSFKDFASAMVETVRATSLIFAIVAGVLIYVHFLGFTGTPAAIANNIVHWNLSPTVVLIGIMALYLFLGMFIDGIGMVLLTVPIISAAAVGLCSSTLSTSRFRWPSRRSSC